MSSPLLASRSVCPIPSPRASRAALAAAVVGALLTGCGGSSSGGSPSATPVATGDQPTVDLHIDQMSVETGAVTVDELVAHGRALFVANFNTLDGAGRPEATGTGGTRTRREAPQNFNRLSGPDANSCAGCHNEPGVGGGGDNVANVFVLAQANAFVDFSGAPGDDFDLDDVANERATIGMNGSGFVELLAREMTSDLHDLRDTASGIAMVSGNPTPVALVTKGVDFGTLTANPDGSFDTSLVEGVDGDLVVKPFHQKGVVVSLREFTNNAMNHHHGIQTRERFGAGVDHDADGIADELLEGDVTALTLFQATLPVPGRVLPEDRAALSAVANGEVLFSAIGCADCHIPELVLDSSIFTEPNPYNPPGNLQVADVSTPLSVDLTQAGPGPHVQPEIGGSVRVRAYTDLKRHDMGTALGEPLVQAGVGETLFLTKKLWGMASEPPFMHHGRCTTIEEAILEHGGDSEYTRTAFLGLSASERRDVIAFLKTLQIMPEGSDSLVDTAPFSGFIGDEPAMLTHLDQADVESGAVDVDQVFEHGRKLFAAKFNSLDGGGRPEATGTGALRARRDLPENFNRISAPDAGSCAACHNVPRQGGGGDNVANVFVLAQGFPFVNFDGGAGDGFDDHRLSTVGNERNTLGMFGAGYIELLARELTVELQQAATDISADALSEGVALSRPLVAKGIEFGTIAASATGVLDTSGVEGVDEDLVVKPFHQKGVVVSLREFSNNAFNHHHGMQTTERFGLGVDHDGDGMSDELTIGDVTAMSLYQALLPPPGRVLPSDPGKRAAVDQGEALFESIGCASCHVPELVLDSAIFTEPNPFNPAGNLLVTQVSAPVAVDLSTSGPGPRLPVELDGSVRVPAYTDLKRHDLGPGLAEAKVQAGVPTTEFLTKKLWGMSNEPPFMHHGRALTIDEAIRMHGGDAQATQDAYLALTDAERRALVDFLHTLQVVPADGPLEIVE
ncbi:Cytochrome c [Planctomycetes bacterium Pla163]|uniref:Cytochrome c n=1 Tax=Rohdeia mirabilis TaxID=2528008 RepID=A0A518CZ12_9BACT|nr:Cytochrome c [Planctomycetes bacterium Pla163]